MEPKQTFADTIAAVPPDKSTADTRTAILEAAKRLFLNTGYHKASMRTLAKEAGISTGPLYFHFQNKSDVFFAICSEGLDLLNADVRLAAEEDVSDAYKLRGIFTAFQQFYYREPLYTQIIRTAFNPLSGVDLTDEQRSVLFGKKLVYMQSMEAVIRSGIANGELQNTDPTRFMLVLIALGEGIFTAQETGDLRHFGVSVEDLVNEASRLTYTGIVNHRPLHPEGGKQ